MFFSYLGEPVFNRPYWPYLKSLLYNVQCSLFIQQPQHHPSTPPFALHPVLNTITLNASALVNTRRLSGIKKIAKQGEEKKEWRREGREKKKRSKEKIRLWWSTTFPKLAQFLAESQGKETMQRCADLRFYRRSLEHWAIGKEGWRRGAKRSVFQRQAWRTWWGTAVAKASRGAWLNWYSRISSTVSKYGKYWPDSLHQGMFGLLLSSSTTPLNSLPSALIGNQTLASLSLHIPGSSLPLGTPALCQRRDEWVEQYTTNNMSKARLTTSPGLFIRKDKTNITTDFCFPSSLCILSYSPLFTS